MELTVGLLLGVFFFKRCQKAMELDVSVTYPRYAPNIGRVDEIDHYIFVTVLSTSREPALRGGFPRSGERGCG